MKKHIHKGIAIVISLCMVTNFLFHNKTKTVKTRNIIIDNIEITNPNKYAKYFDEYNISTINNEKTIYLKAKKSYQKDKKLFDKVSYIEDKTITTYNDKEADEIIDYNKLENSCENTNETYDLGNENLIEDNICEDSEGVLEGDELQDSVFENEDDDLEVEYDCRFDMNELAFYFETKLLSDEGDVIEKKSINTDAIITENGGLDACIKINGYEYMLSDYEGCNAIDDCSIFEVVAIVRAYLAVAETAEKIKAKSNYKYNKKLESDGKGVKKGYLVYSQSNSTTNNRKAANYRFGFTTFNKVGCEVAAAYNLANQLEDTETLSQTIYYFEAYAIEFSIGWGHLGSNPKEIYRFLKKRGFNYKKYTNYTDFKKTVDSKKNCKVIMSRWNSSKWDGLHTFYVKKENYGKHYGYNWRYDSKTASRSGTYKSLNSFNDGSGFIVGYIVWK